MSLFLLPSLSKETEHFLLKSDEELLNIKTCRHKIYPRREMLNVKTRPLRFLTDGFLRDIISLTLGKNS